MRRSLVFAGVIALLATSIALARSGHPVRVHRVAVAGPAQFDATLASVRSRHAGRLRAALSGPSAFDYVAVAVPKHRRGARARALVLVVNRRPRGSKVADVSPVSVRLRTSSPQ